MGQTNTNKIIPMTILSTVDSSTFEVFSAKKFPGMIDTTPLSRCFGEQGIKIPTRSDKKVKRTSIEYNP
ncbi:13742_t:CDS:2, partial [Acaulospora morrowiae]